jgi:hypothetical protein
MNENTLLRFPDGTPACVVCGQPALRLTVKNSKWVCAHDGELADLQPIATSTELVARFRKEVIDRREAERLKFIDRVLVAAGHGDTSKQE